MSKHLEDVAMGALFDSRAFVDSAGEVPGEDPEELYRLAAKNEHRAAARWIWRAALTAKSPAEFKELAGSLDEARLSKFEKHTIDVARNLREQQDQEEI